MNDCPLCQNNSNVSSIKKYSNYDILYCADCQLQFSNPMRDPGGTFYEQCTLYEGRSGSIQLQIPSDDWRYQTCLKLCISKPNQSLLDIGCGDGGFLALARSKGFDIFGIDIDDRAIHLAKNIRNLENVVSGEWEKIYKIKGWRDFDVITMFDLLEHVSSPISLVTTVFKLLRPDGIVCIAVPRLDRYPRVFDHEVDYPPHHFTLWTSDALSVLLNKVGFKEIRIIEKPLMANDILLHLIWRTERFIRKLRRGQTPHTEKPLNAESRSILVKNGVVAKFAKRSILFALTRINWLFRTFHLGRGHTLFALTRIDWFFRTFHLGRGHTLLAIAKKP